MNICQHPYLLCYVVLWTTIVVRDNYGTAQLKHDRTHVWHGLNMTCFSFYMHACKHAYALKIDGVKPIIQSSCVQTRCVQNSLQMYMCMPGMYTPNLDYVYANCKPRTANKLYEHVHVLRCVSPHYKRQKSHWKISC